MKIPVCNPQELQMALGVVGEILARSTSGDLREWYGEAVRVLTTHFGKEAATPLGIRAIAVFKTLETRPAIRERWTHEEGGSVHFHSDFIHAAAAAPVTPDFTFDPKVLTAREKSARAGRDT